MSRLALAGGLLLALACGVKAPPRPPLPETPPAGSAAGADGGAAGVDGGAAGVDGGAAGADGGAGEPVWPDAGLPRTTP